MMKMTRYNSLSILSLWFMIVLQEIYPSFSTEQNEEAEYGLDVSFPIVHRVSTNYPHLDHNRDPKNHPTIPRKYENMPLQTLGDRQEVYLDHLEGCRDYYSDTNEGYLCDTYEYDRMLMNKRQPQSMVNLTETGFKKIRAPKHLHDLITEFWNKNTKNNQPQGVEEIWGAGNSYVNHWNQPTTLISVDDTGLRGSGQTLKRHIWSAASATLEEWTQQELQPCSLYGIRVYHEGAVMLPHVDRLPLVASAMIGVAQDVDEDWPLEIYDHQGRAHNVSITPGDMLLFESHSVIHGHPFPLKGRFHAMIFIHFEPTGHPLGKDESGYYYLRHEEDEDDDVEGISEKRIKKLSKSDRSKREKDAEHQYHENTKKGIGGQSSGIDASNHLPPYIKRESPEEEHWLQQHPDGWEPPEKILPPEAHLAAKQGNIDELEQELSDGERREDVLTQRDENGWQVLHQAVSGGNPDVVKLLVSNGAEINSRTHGGYGETPLRIAEKQLGSDSPIVDYLKGLGALSIGPEL